ncbi:GGDEF domain-containing protein [Fusibacter ferrireducens]|uniref:GGDEF domain-containing protein n=1 Tax=Fusibacter ferrireducens TaxID=2785058 RepID=A0ABR9ZT98_9FIRM|nr:GGDEF domain-containing protein [Fusibacter ferrireducens]MBF4693576.1 GGDEF domain-containing protein [Fusibacter ferrireducens]
MDKIEFLRTLFDYVRVVDPSDKAIKYTFRPEEFPVITQNKCFDFWKQNKICDNCISMSAIKANKTLVKFEIESGKLYLVMASPYEVNGKVCALELIKDITHTNFVEAIDQNKTTDYSDLIARLNQAVITDDLTGLYNKRYVEEHLPYDIKMISYSDKNIFIGIADIDHFKNINDSYGHLVGDKVLTKIGTILKASIRSERDWIARYGGEEFIIVIKGEDEKIFRVICERIRKEVEATKMKFSDQEFNVTISIGGVGIHPSTKCHFEDLISRADENLYKAKNNGRNQCIVEFVHK